MQDTRISMTRMGERVSIGKGRCTDEALILLVLTGAGKLPEPDNARDLDAIRISGGPGQVMREDDIRKNGKV